MQEDSFISSTGPDQFSETAIYSGSDSEPHGPPTPSQDRPPQSAPLESEPPPTPLEQENHVDDSPSEVRSSASSESDVDMLSPAREPAEDERLAGFQENTEPAQVSKEAETTAHQGKGRSASTLSRKLSSDSLSVSLSADAQTSFSLPHHVISTRLSQSCLLSDAFFSDPNIRQKIKEVNK